MDKNIEIYNYCEERWDSYEKIDGGYYPSKHDSKVLSEAAQKFQITIEQAREAFNVIAKSKAELSVKNLNKNQINNLAEKVVRNNKETPWGMGLDKE